ncbi:MAG: efflux transporter outer membrane subunit [Candidatus Eremiobacteraeota bacterium]|nr:efflux transporter outer membrane subunit [Candidatus Eremiobacteraeota bacterium]
MNRQRSYRARNERSFLAIILSAHRQVLFIFTIILFLSLFLVSCREDPKYKRPPVPVPTSYRGYSEGALYNMAPSGLNTTLGDLFWWELLQDDALKDLIQTAIKQNYDVRLAVERIQEARANVGIYRSSQFPQVTGTANYKTEKISSAESTQVLSELPDSMHSFSASLQAVFELDFWGRLRKSTEAAKYQLLATEEAKNTVLMTLVGEVTSSYFYLLELDMEKEICEKTLKSREESLKLVKTREKGGVATMLDVDQSQGLVYSAQKAKTGTEQLIAQQENYINFLLGRNPQTVLRGKKTLVQQIKEPPLPPGLPSSLLESRPDIRMAEQQLIASNIEIGVARAAYFPQVTLTGARGVRSKDLTDLFTNPGNTWIFQPQITVPIFNGGRIRSQVKVAESQKRQAIIQYEKTVQNAFREVSDALIGYSRKREFRVQSEALTATLKDQSRLSNLRYEAGVTSYLEVLDTERQYFESELELSKARLDELLYVIKLYKALGGGWKQK